MRRAPAGLLLAVLGSLATCAAAAEGARHEGRAPRTLRVCPEPSAAESCEFRGGDGIQQAVDAAVDGDTVWLGAGVYEPARTRDVQYGMYTMPGYVVIDDKDLALVGEPGTVLQGAANRPGTGIVVNRARVSIRDIALKGLEVASSEDDRYDGHGIFIIDSAVTLDGITMEGIAKMGLTLRGGSTVEATGLVVRDGHIGVWLEESAHLTLRDSLLARNESAGICAYMDASASVYDTVIEGNADDGLYAEDRASIYVTGSTIRGNRPYGARAVADGQIRIENSHVHGNEHNFSRSMFGRRVTQGAGVIEAAPGPAEDTAQ